MTTKGSTTRDTRLALKIAERCKPFLRGHTPEVQGAALAELLSLFLAGHVPELRETILDMHIKVVRDLTKVNARIVRGE